MKKILTANLLVLSVLVACKNQKYQVEDSNKNDFELIERKVKKLNFNYMMTEQVSSLDSAYVLMNESGYLKKVGLKDQNMSVLFPILFFSERYSELNDLLEKSEGLDTSFKEYSLNLSNAYLNYKKGEIGAAQNNIRANVNLLEHRMQLHPNDSIILVDYFKMRVHLESYSELLQEIDSLSSTGGEPTPYFYNWILKPDMEEYRKELPVFVKNEIQ
ncbi:hypothetical protein [Mangrovimonas sp. TPBH4]|uniref:hypothetical protein n=1 Tax=Mangrovimonas sp. TPBH4 TaxID=1645914 RepID=UPI0006B60BE8|nr:hypothetical protein [Mangrovimonas sp. TPBH4]